MSTPPFLSLDTKLPVLAIIGLAVLAGAQGNKIAQLEKDRDEMKDLFREIPASIKSIEMLLVEHVAGHKAPVKTNVSD
jgi:hypothetical protein